MVENFVLYRFNQVKKDCIFVERESSKTQIMQTETLTLQEEIDALKAKLTGDMFQDMDIKDQIHNLEMKLNGVKPMDSHIDCIGCGS